MSVKTKWFDKEFLTKLDKDVNDKLTLAGELVTSAAKQNAPVKTGHLRNSISYDVDKQNKSVTIGTNVNYAPYVELGTRHIKASFFLTKALKENITNIKLIFKKKIV